MGVIEFFKTLSLSMYPLSYHDFSQKSGGEVARYFLAVVFLGMVICNLLLLPMYFGLPNTINEALGKFTVFEVDGDVEMSGPIEVPKREASFVVDTTGTIKEIQQERVIITSDYIYYRPFFSNKRIAFDNLFDVVNNKGDITWILIALIFVLLPSFLFYAYAILALKFFVLIFLTSFLLYFIVRVLMLYEISFKNAMSSAFYAGTLMIMLESILFPINSELLLPLFSIMGGTYYLVSHLAYVIFGLVGMIIVEKDIHINKKKKKQKEE